MRVTGQARPQLPAGRIQRRSWRQLDESSKRGTDREGLGGLQQQHGLLRQGMRTSRARTSRAAAGFGRSSAGGEAVTATVAPTTIITTTEDEALLPGGSLPRTG